MSQTTPIKITVDKQAIRRIESDLMHIKHGAPRAMSRAINHTLGVTRTEASKEIRKQVKLKAGYVRDKLTVKRATVNSLNGAIRTPTRGTLLTRYPHRAYKEGGAGVQVKPSGGKSVCLAPSLSASPTAYRRLLFAPNTALAWGAVKASKCFTALYQPGV
ncbi:hypothetical protein HORIV_35250 [Vreelandella olivaria]|uniref:Minor tail protein n=1 Tax=Vreelandella olivaria TaxID=390919 RepID=A0ABN5WVX2_9GAMM|nr:hypothetical protein HORIV_35250 [Halomonas olivaria]